MTRDHFGFFVFLSCLLIAPKIPLKFMGLAGKSTVSLGIVGLLFWSCVSSGRFIKRKYLTFPFPIKGLILFGAYALGVSLLSLNNVSILYAGQYFLYVCFASFLLNSYIRRAFEMRQIGLSYRIIALVGLAYGLGVIVSLWTGPLYPQQTMAVARRWGGVLIQQGVGFAEGPNAAGAILIIFCSFYWFVYRSYQRRAWLYAAVAILALFTTVSRSAIFSYCIIISIYLVIKIIRSILLKKISKHAASYAVSVVLVLAFLIAGGYGILSQTEGPRILIKTAMEGFGVDDQGGMLPADIFTRISLWQDGIDAWAKGTVKDRVFGRGFRGSFELTSDNSAWITQHNVYIAILSDFGVIGATLFVISLLGGLIQIGSKWIRTGGSGEERGALVALSALLVHNMSEVFLYSPGLMSMLILILVLAYQRAVNPIKMVRRSSFSAAVEKPFRKVPMGEHLNMIRACTGLF